MYLGPKRDLTKPSRTGPKPLKPVKRVGKRTKDYLRTRRAYMAAQIPDWQGKLACRMCGNRFKPYELELDHIKKRSVAPDKVLDFANFQLLCSSCHRKKHL